MGTIMVFLGVVPLAVGAFGNYMVPIQVGAPDMAFPRLNMASYWVYFVGGIVMMLGFLTPGGKNQKTKKYIKKNKPTEEINKKKNKRRKKTQEKIRTTSKIKQIQK